MSPYRVLAIHEESKSELILAAMLHVEKLYNHHEIYIVIKHSPSDDLSIITKQTVAYSQTTSNNSIILDKYDIVRSLDVYRHYRVRHQSSDSYLEDYCPTQQRCLKIALDDFCDRNNITIQEVL